MVAVQLSSENAAWLDAQGYEIAELKGFDDHRLPLYTHRAVSDKQPGDVVIRARVGNPAALDDGEAVYLARKASYGFFPWRPGDECMQRRFQDVSYTRNGIGSTKVERGESLMGCRWCRERAAEGTKRRKGRPAKSEAARARRAN
jgi:hypothetical protein